MNRSPVRIAVVAGFLSLCAALAPRLALAGEDLLVPGGTGALLASAGIKVPPQRWDRLLMVIRVLHEAPEGQNRKATASLASLASYLTAITELQDALGADARVTLAAAAQNPARERLKRILDLVGFRLVARGTGYRVESAGDRAGAERRALFVRAGVPLDGIEKRLNAGETIELAIPVEPAPLPLPIKTWADSVFERPVAADRLAAAILLDRRAALLYYGLASLDDATLAFLALHPALVSRIYRDHAAIFSTCGRSLHVRQGALEVPGGDEGRPIWEAIVNQKTSSPESFVGALLQRDAGRLAWFYDTAQHLDGPRQRFLLCHAAAAGRAREECVRSVYTVFRDFQPGWKPMDRPFSRCALDPVLVLSQIRVSGDGALAAPAWRLLWQAAFDREDLPDDPSRDMRDVARGGDADAPWLLRALSVESILLRQARLSAVAFTQRAFAAATVQAAPDLYVVACAFRQYAGLMLTLERAGLSDPAIYARAAVVARGVGRTADKDRLALELAAFQGPLAFLQHAAATPALDRAAARALVESFLDIPRGTAAARGGLARWVDAQLVPRLPAARPDDDPEAPAETRMLRALAGSAAAPVPAAVVRWEGRAYRVDVAAAEFARLQEIRRRQHDNTVDDALRLWRVAAALSAGSADGDIARSSAARLVEIGETLQPLEPGPLLGPRPPALKRTIEDAVSGLARIGEAKDARQLPAVASRLAELADAMLARTFASLAYAVSIADPRSALLIAGNPALQHEFVPEETPESQRLMMPWTLPAEQALLERRWHMGGSLLGVDVGLARLLLRRVSGQPPDHPPTMNANHIRVLQHAVVLMNPYALTDAAQGAIAAALERGRERVGRLASDPASCDAGAAEGHLGEWRHHAMPWMASHEPDRIPTLFSLSEILRLGQPAVDPATLDAWGGVMIPFDGSYRLAMPPGSEWEAVSGRPSTSLLGAALVDVNLRVAEALDTRHLPAVLARAVVASAMQAFFDAADLNDDDDWPAAVRAARELTDECLDDCVSALTAGGPLVPVGTDDPKID